VKHSALTIACLAVVAVAASGIAAADQRNAPGSPPAVQQDTAAKLPGSGSMPIVPPNYVVGPNDRLRIIVWNQDNISGDYVVSGDGSFTFPLIGRVNAGGLTIVQLEAELKRMLSAGYFRNPHVTAAVADYRSKQIFVMGALRQPGAYAVIGEISLIEALARAGSTSTDAADHAFVIRSASAEGPVLPGEDASATVTRVDLRELDDGDLPAAAMVRDRDTVYVPRASTVFVYGQVRNPGLYPVTQGTTVRQALSLAGGAAEFGAVNRVRVLRFENGQEQEIKVELNDVVKPGDTIVVPERFF
jgi:polysaccharide export outer membrane protein